MILLAAVVLWLLYLRFGSQVFGVPALVGVLVVLGVISIAPTLGLLTLAAIVLGVVVLFLVIGLAVSVGPERLPKARDERPPQE